MAVNTAGRAFHVSATLTRGFVTPCALAFCLLVGVEVRAQPASTPHDAEPPPALHGSADALAEKLTGVRASRDEQQLETASAELLQRKYAAAWPNLPALSLVLERDGKQAMALGDHRRARRLFQLARDLSPSLVSPRLWLLSAGLRDSPLAFGGHTREAASALRVALSDHRTAHLFIANLASGAWLSLIIVAFATLALIFLRQARYVAHDVSLALPRGTSHVFVYPLFILLIGIPVAFRFGALSVSFVLVWLPFLHGRWRERLSLSLAFAAIVAAPLLIEPLAESWVTTQGRGADLYALTRTNAFDEALQRIEREPESVERELAIGLALKHRGDTEAALARFEHATKLAPDRADAWTNYGAALFWMERFDDAEAAFHKAAEIAPASIPALFNISRMFERAGQNQKSSELLARAQTLDPEQVTTLLAIARMVGPRFIAEQMLPNDDLWRAKRHAAESDLARAASHGLLPYVVGGRAVWLFLAAGVAWLALLWLLAIVMRRTELALPCPRCGRPICRRTDKDLPDRSVCGECHHVFVVQDADTALRVAKEVACRRYERRRAQLVTFSSIVLAGSGHILRGRTLSGALLVGFAGATLMLGLVALSVMPLPFRTWNAPLGPRLALTVVLWLTAAAVALATVPKKD